MIDDPTLLRRYIEDASPAAFSDLVRRHLPLVYSAALRRLNGDTHRAEDIAQSVFCALARDARKLIHHPSLTGWLYTTTRNAVIDTLRRESHRRTREQEASLMHASLPDTPADWTRLKPVLDDAMDNLSPDDREAVLLRFFQGRAFAEIGSALHLTEDAARKRVDRALEKLRDLLSHRGIPSTSAALAAVLGTEAIAAVPAHLTVSIAATATLSGGAVAGGALFAVTKLQLGLGAAIVAGSAAGFLYQRQTITELRTELAERQAQVHPAPPTASAPVLALLPASLNGPAPARPPTPSTVAAAPTPTRLTAQGTLSVLPGTPELDARRKELHRRYDPFVQQRGLNTEQGNRVIELLLHQALAREDLQAAVRNTGAAGGTEGVEKLRSQLYAPIVRELQEILTSEGYAAWGVYEQQSFIKMAFIDPLVPDFNRASDPLSESQSAQLAQVFQTSRTTSRANPTDIGLTWKTDWPAVLERSKTFLTPRQHEILAQQAARRTQR